MNKKLLLVIATLLTISMAAVAQITNSSLAGAVTYMGSTETVIGATVQAVHEPSGTRYTAITNSNGLFTIQGMRPGGPYVVTVSYIGCKPSVTKDIILQLGETTRLDTKLAESTTELNEVVVSGNTSKFTTQKTGPSTNISARQIENMPNPNRQLTDIVRLSPYGGNGMILASRDGRTANFTIDGANFNNDFGTNMDLPGGGNPISIDAIAEMQILISPYDVRQTDFIGGGVNAITKSGTNTLRGTAYVYHRNENMHGDAVNREQIAGTREKDQNTIYGFTLGGPIIKNKLFFFANGEMAKTPTVVNRWRGSEDGVADPTNYISRVRLSDLERVSQYVADKYGYSTGSWTNYPAVDNNYKFLARIDWNITDKHHLALRYNFTDNSVWKSTNVNSMDGAKRSSYGRLSQYAMAYANSLYQMKNKVHSFSIDLNSRLTENISNQFLATYTKKDDVRATDSSDFPFVDILDGAGGNYISLGHELFSWKTGIHNDVWNVKDDATYYLGRHKIMAGISYEYKMADNVYMRNGTGYYRYRSIDDFLTGAAPEVVALTYGYNGEMEPAVRVRNHRLGFYLQDEWELRSNLKLTYGLRLDELIFDNKDLMTNNAIAAIDYNGRSLDTGKWPDNNLTISPRVGVVWDVFGDKSLKVRGGTGLFQGRLPLVFLTNMPSSSNMLQYNGIWNTTGLNKGLNIGEEAMAKHFAGDIKTRMDLYRYVTTNGLGPANITPEDGQAGSTISGVVRDFKLPQVWKTSLAVDYQVPVAFPMTVTLEGVVNKNINDVYIQDWSYYSSKEQPLFKGADCRPEFVNVKYTDANGKALPNAYVLSNTSKGYGWLGNVTVTAKPFKWLDLMAAYTHTVQKEVSGMPGNDPSSTFANIPSYKGPNETGLHNSLFVIPDRFVASASLHDKSGNHYSFIYEGSHGGVRVDASTGYTMTNNVSYMLTNDMNQDGYSYDLVYIPRDDQVGVGKGEFRFTSEDDMKRFMDFVHSNDYLKRHQGEYAGTYGDPCPWVHRIDFSYKHDFNFNVRDTKHKLQLSFDMKNVLNFFDSTWGVAKYLNPAIGNDARILTYAGKDAEGYPLFSTPAVISGKTETWTWSYDVGQCWYASIGLKYFFN